MPDPTLVNQLFAILLAFLTSWQLKTLLGLIVADVLFGVASALRRGVFDWGKLANFYKTDVLPYILGYLALYVSVGFIIPPDSGVGEPFNQGAVTLAWLVLVGSLIKSIVSNFGELYRGASA